MLSGREAPGAAGPRAPDTRSDGRGRQARREGARCWRRRTASRNFPPTASKSGTRPAPATPSPPGFLLGVGLGRPLDESVRLGNAAGALCTTAAQPPGRRVPRRRPPADRGADGMTPRERVLAVLGRERPDKLPRELKLTPPLLEEFERRTGSNDPAEYLRARDARRLLRPADRDRRLQRLLSRGPAAVLEPGRLGSGGVGGRRHGRLDAPFHPPRASDEAPHQASRSSTATRSPT